MGDIGMKQPLPTSSLQQIDPFLLLHHAGPMMQEAGGRNVMPIGPHPHRGFEPVTFVFKGAVHHKDSRGNDSIIRSGGVQWMTAGMGIVHSETLAKELLENGGELELIQLWINLPTAKKMIQPKYQGFQKEEIPTVVEDGSSINIISGSYKGKNGPINSETAITALTINMIKGSTISFDVDPNENQFLYQLSGMAKVNDIENGSHKLVYFGEEGDFIKIECSEDATFLFMSGKPLNEKVTQWGPYVMNTQTEIMEAMRDYQMGKMGILID
jgi:redox-sensitive bicupin YhaK (pirin superfamily)